MCSTFCEFDDSKPDRKRIDNGLDWHDKRLIICHWNVGIIMKTESLDLIGWSLSQVWPILSTPKSPSCFLDYLGSYKSVSGMRFSSKDIRIQPSYTTFIAGQHNSRALRTTFHFNQLKLFYQYWKYNPIYTRMFAGFIKMIRATLRRFTRARKSLDSIYSIDLLTEMQWLILFGFFKKGKKNSTELSRSVEINPK